MSRGLGKTQRAILDILEYYRERWDGWAGVETLAAQVYHPERWEYEEMVDWSIDPAEPYYSVTRAEYVATHRAVQSLERRGLVETKDANHMAGGSYITGGKGGPNRHKRVKLKC